MKNFNRIYNNEIAKLFSIQKLFYYSYAVLAVNCKSFIFENYKKRNQPLRYATQIDLL